MGFFNKLFNQTPNHQEAEQIFLEGRTKLWARQMGEAEKLLNKAVHSHAQPALPLAYLSLLKRMRMEVSAALEDANRAIDIAPNCFEAHAARAVALLTDKNLVDAMATYGEAGKYSPHDAGGHYLNLVIYLLFVEMLLNASEGQYEIKLNFKLTPVTRGATRLVDGYPLLALDEFKKAEESLLKFIGMGLAFYELSDYSSSSLAFKTVSDSLPVGVGGHYRLSIKRLWLDSEKHASSA